MNESIRNQKSARPTANASLSALIATGRHLLRVKRLGLADHIGGFSEWIALCGYTRQQADRLVRLAMLAEGSTA